MLIEQFLFHSLFTGLSLSSFSCLFKFSLKNEFLTRQTEECAPTRIRHPQKTLKLSKQRKKKTLNENYSQFFHRFYLILHEIVSVSWIYCWSFYPPNNNTKIHEKIRNFFNSSFCRLKTISKKSVVEVWENLILWSHANPKRTRTQTGEIVVRNRG